MKLLHIGNEKSFKRYTPDNDFTRNTETIHMANNLPEAEYLNRMPDADVIIADAIAGVSAELINAMPSLKLIHSEGVAYNCIDLEAAKKRGIYVCNCAGVNAQSVAEQTILLMQGVLRDVVRNDAAVRDGRQIQVKMDYMSEGSLKNLADCRIGLVGLGAIGKRTAALLKAYQTLVYYAKRHRENEDVEREYGVTWANSLGELLGKCNMVSVHVPVTPETFHMCNAAFFNAMPQSSYFINTSRGELVDNEALIDALRNGRIAMAGLDTLDNEPVEKTHILINQPKEIADKLLFSPHIGGITGSSFAGAYKLIWENIRRVADGDVPVSIVNL